MRAPIQRHDRRLRFAIIAVLLGLLGVPAHAMTGGVTPPGAPAGTLVNGGNVGAVTAGSTNSTVGLLSQGQTVISTAGDGNYTGQVFITAGNNGLEVDTTTEGPSQPGKVFIMSAWLGLGPYGNGSGQKGNFRWFDMNFATLDLAIPDTLGSSYKITMPAAPPAAVGQTLVTDLSGNLAWGSPSFLSIDVALTGGTGTQASGKTLSSAIIISVRLKTPITAVGQPTATISGNSVVVTSYAAGAVQAVTDTSTYTVVLSGAL
jgi:hypothetical protein